MAEKQSLAAQAGALTQGVKLPDTFMAPMEPVKARFIAPYMVFCHPKRSDEWAKIQKSYSSVQEGDMFLIESEKVTRLEVAKLGILCCTQYWSESNAAGEVQRTSRVERPKPFKEHIEAVVLVYLPDRVVPANVQFRTVKCPAGKALSDALIEASNPDWGKKSPQHADSMACTQPFMRFYGEVSILPQRTSKTSGMTYRPTSCAIKPTSMPEWKLLKAFVESADSQKSLEDAAAWYQQRISEVASKLAK